MSFDQFATCRFCVSNLSQGSKRLRLADSLSPLKGDFTQKTFFLRLFSVPPHVAIRHSIWPSRVIDVFPLFHSYKGELWLPPRAHTQRHMCAVYLYAKSGVTARATTSSSGERSIFYTTVDKVSYPRQGLDAAFSSTRRPPEPVSHPPVLKSHCTPCVTMCVLSSAHISSFSRTSRAKPVLQWMDRSQLVVWKSHPERPSRFLWMRILF